jgi:hypothetical protein
MKPSDLLRIVDESGSEDFNLVDISENRFKDIAGKFFLQIQKSATKNNVVASGRMLSDENFKYTITPKPDGSTIIDLFMIYYADFVNQGVQGVKSNVNAPRSPYKFKNLGMSASGRKSILEYITSGKAKVTDVTKTKYGKVGIERKSKETPSQEEINQREAERMIYLIKAFGIKETNFIREAWNEFKKEFGNDLGNAIFKAV